MHLICIFSHVSVLYVLEVSSIWHAGLISFRFFDISKTNAKRSYRVIQVVLSYIYVLGTSEQLSELSINFRFLLNFVLQDTHNVRSVSFHPSGDFLLAGIYFYLIFPAYDMLMVCFSLVKWIRSPFVFLCFLIVSKFAITNISLWYSCCGAIFIVCMSCWPFSVKCYLCATKLRS